MVMLSSNQLLGWVKTAFARELHIRLPQECVLARPKKKHWAHPVGGDLHDSPEERKAALRTGGNYKVVDSSKDQEAAEAGSRS